MRRPSWAHVDRLEAIDLPWREDTPAERALRDARRAVAQAERRHKANVRAHRRELAKAERAHRRAVQRARRALDQAERTEDKQIRTTESALRSATKGAELQRFLQLRLYEDRLESPEIVVPVRADLRAMVGEEESLRTLALRQTITRMHDRRAPGRHAGPRKLRAGHVYLLVETSDVAIVAACDEQTGEASAFAQAVNVAALNADRLASKRATAAASLVEALDQLRGRRETVVAEAGRTLETVEADTAGIAAAQEALAAAAADTDEIARAQEELERVLAEQGSSQG